MGRSKKGPINVNKKGKSKKETWKKISHPDIDDYLEDVREDERLGGITKLPDSSLFMFDLKPSDESFSSAIRKEEKPAKKSDKLVDVLELKCFSNLKPDSKVKDPLIKRDRIRKPGEKKSLKMIEIDLKRRQKKAQKAEEDVKPDLDKLKLKLQMKDPWEAPTSTSNELDTTWLRPTSIRANLRLRPRKNFHKTSEIAAVEPPHPGFSYNPSFVDHQDLLKMSTEIESKKFEAEKKLERATAIPKFIPHQPEEHLLIQPAPGDEESEEDDKEEVAKKQKRSRTRQSKRHEHDAKTLELEIKAKKDVKRKEAEVYNIKNLQKDINNSEWVNKARLNEKVQRKILHQRFGQKMLGRTKYEEPSLNPALSEELEGSLISVPNSNSLLSDRFKSLQKRNIIEPRVKNTNKRKHKLKKYTRQSERMEWEKTGMWEDIKIL